MNRSEAMEEALRFISDMAIHIGGGPYVSSAVVNKIFMKAAQVLALPRRNCDVGTVKEQQDRYDAFERRRWMCRKGKSALEWGQLPCKTEEGGAE